MNEDVKDKNCPENKSSFTRGDRDNSSKDVDSLNFSSDDEIDEKLLVQKIQENQKQTPKIEAQDTPIAPNTFEDIPKINIGSLERTMKPDIGHKDDIPDVDTLNFSSDDEITEVERFDDVEFIAKDMVLEKSRSGGNKMNGNDTVWDVECAINKNALPVTINYQIDSDEHSNLKNENACSSLIHQLGEHIENGIVRNEDSNNHSSMHTQINVETTESSNYNDSETRIIDKNILPNHSLDSPLRRNEPPILLRKGKKLNEENHPKDQHSNIITSENAIKTDSSKLRNKKNGDYIEEVDCIDKDVIDGQRSKGISEDTPSLRVKKKDDHIEEIDFTNKEVIDCQISKDISEDTPSLRVEKNGDYIEEVDVTNKDVIDVLTSKDKSDTETEEDIPSPCVKKKDDYIEEIDFTNKEVIDCQISKDISEDTPSLRVKKNGDYIEEVDVTNKEVIDVLTSKDKSDTETEEDIESDDEKVSNAHTSPVPIIVKKHNEVAISDHLSKYTLNRINQNAQIDLSESIMRKYTSDSTMQGSRKKVQGEISDTPKKIRKKMNHQNKIDLKRNKYRKKSEDKKKKKRNENGHFDKPSKLGQENDSKDLKAKHWSILDRNSSSGEDADLYQIYDNRIGYKKIQNENIGSGKKLKKTKKISGKGKSSKIDKGKKSKARKVKRSVLDKNSSSEDDLYIYESTDDETEDGLLENERIKFKEHANRISKKKTKETKESGRYDVSSKFDYVKKSKAQKVNIQSFLDENTSSEDDMDLYQSSDDVVKQKKSEKERNFAYWEKKLREAARKKRDSNISDLETPPFETHGELNSATNDSIKVPVKMKKAYKDSSPPAELQESASSLYTDTEQIREERKKKKKKKKKKSKHKNSLIQRKTTSDTMRYDKSIPKSVGTESVVLDDQAGTMLHTSHPYIGKLVKVVGGKFKGKFGRITKVKSRGWWVLDNPELGNCKVQSGQCKMIDSVPDEVLLKYYSDNGMRFKNPPALNQSYKNAIIDANEVVQEKKKEKKKRKRKIALPSDNILVEVNSKKTLNPKKKRKNAKRYEYDSLYIPPSTKTSSEASIFRSRFDTSTINNVELEFTPEVSLEKPGSVINQIDDTVDREVLYKSNTTYTVETEHQQHAIEKPSVLNKTVENRLESMGEQSINTTERAKNESISAMSPMSRIHKPVPPISHTTVTQRSIRSPSLLPPVALNALNDDIPPSLRHLSPDTKIDIFDRKTCKILSGANAVCVRDLPNILRLHAEYEPIIPPATKSRYVTYVFCTFSLKTSYCLHDSSLDYSRKRRIIRREGRSSRNVRVSAIVNRQTPLQSNTIVGKRVIISSGHYRGLIGKYLKI